MINPVYRYQVDLLLQVLPYVRDASGAMEITEYPEIAGTKPGKTRKRFESRRRNSFGLGVSLEFLF